MGPRGATHRSACPVLRHSESGPLGLSAWMWGCRVCCGWTACPVHPTLRQSRSRHGHSSPLHPGARLRPSYRSGWMFIFYFLGVGLPCHSIFCQFWLCEEAQCVYLRRHLGSSLFFTNNFMLIWIFCVCWLSPTWCNVDCSQVMSQTDHWSTQLWSIAQQETSQTTFAMFDQSQHLLHTLHESFFAFQFIFSFLK